MSMAQILVRNIDDDLKARLKQRARQNGVSMEEAVRLILRNELGRGADEEKGLGTRIAELFRGIEGNDEPLPEFPRSEIKPMRFED